jgi:hypothetical protein
MTLKIDLLAIDMAAGKHWIQRVTAEIDKAKIEWHRARRRAKWLHSQGREIEAQKLDAIVQALEAKWDFK